MKALFVKAPLFGTVALLAISTAAATAGAAVTLQSAEITNNRGSNYFSPGNPPINSSSSTTSPFPNDANNSATIGPDGLDVRVALLATGTASQGLLGFSKTWNDYAFSVVFDVDEPSAFTFNRTFGFTNDLVDRPTLQAEGRAPVQLPLFGNATGVLEPGRYTFSGATTTSGVQPPAIGGTLSDTRLFTTRLTVVPEPGALSLLSLPALWLLRRHSRTPQARRG